MKQPPAFVLDARIEADTVPIGRLPLCRVLLHRDANYPWVILVPERPGLTEVHQLSDADRHVLADESTAVAATMQRLFGALKMNVATLGNVVPQLHVHHVARFPEDAAWPGPIWGARPAGTYTGDALRERCDALVEALAVVPGFQRADER